MYEEILVTGGCGFIATNLVRRLHEDGRHVTILDNLSQWQYRDPQMAGVDFVERDITELADLGEAFNGIDAVIHLAASGSVVESMANPEANFRNNAVGTFNVLEAARRAGTAKVVFASTGGALIGDAEPPVDEYSVPRPISPYGASKLCGEAYAGAFGRAYDMETVSLRFANVYGPHSAHKKGAVTAFMKAVMAGDPLIIYGDGAASRDFLYVDDMCEGIMRALDTAIAPGSTFHIASGVETTVAELALAVLVACGKPGHPIEHRPERPGEVERNFARYDRARETLGYAPRWSLAQGLRATWDWFQQADGLQSNS